ncbi:N-acetylglucosamine kinase [Catellatospora sp. TT07R-123]|uniref:N-acetylglucosamine kinase n=1 Tax=Catellatospora sp. TT07R-123 TaxID=2733863 RepID=UPI001B0E9AA8|nr:BadF/BadG/BcrA/BcrD ATPase family protein [Catellatospora sp. TT07R-123]GHJ49154.1 N-acetylglucosamine kinase [Catellatospora sp. TT07R-123]
MTYVLGLDVGGTASRALLTTLDGARVGFGRAGAGNPVAVPLDEAVTQVATAARDALSGADGARIQAAVMGIAGAGRFTDPVIAAAFAAGFAQAGVPVAVRPVGDVDVAYAAGATVPDGTVLICGTGAIAARIEGWELGSTADGLGWLLGDLGSGFWLGRAAAATAARELYAGRADSRLVRQVTVALLGLRPDLAASPPTVDPSPLLAVDPGPPLAGDPGSPPGADPAPARTARRGPSRQDADDLVNAVHERSPRTLAQLAPLVTEAAVAGDRLALAIVAEAAGHLVDTACEVHAGGPVVLAGSVLRHAAPLRDAVLASLALRLPGTPVTVAGPGEVGAARLAAASLP